MYFAYVHENRTMTPVESVLKRGKGEGGKRENDGGVNLVKINLHM
jgi:hypothetical protein